MPRRQDSVRVTHRFDASAERIYDAFLDPARAGKFLFATPTGRIVRCEIDARVGGTFTIVDRRDGEDVAHTGKYLALDRPHRIAFTLSVAKYSSGEFVQGEVHVLALLRVAAGRDQKMLTSMQKAGVED